MEIKKRIFLGILGLSILVLQYLNGDPIERTIILVLVSAVLAGGILKFILIRREKAKSRVPTGR